MRGEMETNKSVLQKTCGVRRNVGRLTEIERPVSENHRSGYTNNSANDRKYY